MVGVTGSIPVAPTMTRSTSYANLPDPVTWTVSKAFPLCRELAGEQINQEFQ